MLRIFSSIGARLSRRTEFSRHFSTEAVFDKEKKIKIYELEIDMLRQEGRKAPDLEKLRPQDWEHIVGLPSKSARRKYYQFLWQNEMKREAVSIKKEQRKIENAERLGKQREENLKNEHIVYGLNFNSMFMRIYDATINHFHNMKLIRAMQFDQKLVIDCSYDEHMNPREASNAGKQLMLCFAENRMHDEPFDLQFCNVNLNSISAKTLHKFVPTMLDEDFPMNIHTESMVDKFDKSKLVYLTPHCNNDLVKFNHDDIYIIGAMVDKTNNEPLSLAKAKKQGLRMARLPLDRYLAWSSGSGKSLTLNQMVNIMLEMKKHGDWERALRFVPRRKIVDEEEEMERNQDRRNQFRGGQYRGRSESFSNRGNFSNRDNFNNRDNFDNRESFNNRDSLNNRENFSNHNNVNNHNNFSNRNNYNNFNNPRRGIIDEEDDFDQTQDSRDFQNNHQRGKFDNFNNPRNNSQRNSFDKNRSDREKKHFERFKFDLNSWGKKVNQK